jgi:hypothetical protein
MESPFVALGPVAGKGLKGTPAEKPARVYSCAQCGFQCRDSGNIVRHRRRHGTERPYACHQHCGRGYINSSNRRKHEQACGSLRATIGAWLSLE